MTGERDMTTKEYFGDGVYAELIYGTVKLTTENGVEATNTIYLEPEVIDALLRYLARHKQEEEAL